MDMMHFYSKRVDGNPHIFGKLPSDLNPFLFIFRVILISPNAALREK